MKLQDDCGIQIDHHKIIANKFISDFTQRFKYARNTNKVISNLGLPKLISDIDSIELTKPPNLDEVEDALSSIDSNKPPGPDGFGAFFFQELLAYC